MPIGAGIDTDAVYAPAIREAKGLTLAFLGYVIVDVEELSPFFDTAT